MQSFLLWIVQLRTNTESSRLSFKAFVTTYCDARLSFKAFDLYLGISLNIYLIWLFQFVGRVASCVFLENLQLI